MTTCLVAQTWGVPGGLRGEVRIQTQEPCFKGWWEKGSLEGAAASREGKRESGMTREEEGRNAGWTTERMLVLLSEGGSPTQGSKEKHRRCRGGGGHEGLNMSPESGRESAASRRGSI